MEKTLEMGKASATGSFQLLVGKAASTVIMAIGTLILARLMSPEEYGLYHIALLPAMMISLFQDLGVSSAMTKYIANFKVANKNEEIHDVIVAGVIFEVATGLALSFLSLFLASFIASTIFHRPESASLISVVSVTIFSGSLLAASQSSFIGFERMKLSSFTVICQSIVKSTASPLLVLLGYGVLGATLGYTLSFLVAGIIGLLTLYAFCFKNLGKTKTNRSKISKILKTMLKYGLPLSICSVLGGILVQFYGFMMAFFCNDIMIGNYQVAANFAVLLTFFTTPISTVLFPAFAKLEPQNENQLLKTIFASSVKYTALLLVPATMLVIVLSKPMISTLYGEKWVYAPFFLTLYVLLHLLTVFGNLSQGSFLAGLGETKILMKQTLLTLIFGVPLAFLLIPTFGIVGVILGGILAALPSTFWSLHWTWKHYKVKADFTSSAKILAASTIATITTYLFINFFYTAEWIRLTTGGIIFLAVYIFTAPMIGAIVQSDIDNLKAIISGLGIIAKIINIPLDLIEKVVTLRSVDKKTAQVSK